MYSNHFVFCVLISGQPTKELANGVVSLPFGTEYSLRFRNKHSRRAVVKIFIDGENVSGGGYIIPANDYVDIKRHHDKDRSFKFVSLDSPDAVDFGKDGPNHDKVKGTIEARFYLEKEQPKYTYREPRHIIHRDIHHHHYEQTGWPSDTWPLLRNPYSPTVTCDASPQQDMRGSGETKGATLSLTGLKRSRGPSGQSTNSSDVATFKRISVPLERRTLPSADTLSLNEAAPLQDGCTVEGDTTGQSFTKEWLTTEETYTSLKIFLQGYEEEEVVVAAEPKRKTNKSKRLDDLESENEELRRKLAEIENEQLKEKLAEKPAPKKKAKPKAKPRTSKKKTT